MPLYHNKWRGFLNKGVKPTLTEEELLAEGRLEDVKKKYVELDKRGIIDDLSVKDPSGNNAYLGWMTKRWQIFLEIKHLTMHGRISLKRQRMPPRNST